MIVKSVVCQIDKKAVVCQVLEIKECGFDLNWTGVQLFVSKTPQCAGLSTTYTNDISIVDSSRLHSMCM